MEGKMEAKIIDNYIITNQKLGEGTFGTVYRGYLKDDKAKILAVKQIELKNLKGDYRLLKRELELLNLLESPNIVKFYKPMRTPNNLYFFLEYCQTDLKKYMKSKKEGYLS
jgi:serine/threonine protein kinase